MNNSIELQRLADSISSLASTITEIIDSRVQTACAKRRETSRLQYRRGGRDTDVIVSEPTVAPNSGAQISANLRRTFVVAGLPDAEFIRLPAPRTRCQLTGLSRTGLNELIASKLIRAIKVRKPGAQRGVVLIGKRSLLEYLHELDIQQNGHGQ